MSSIPFREHAILRNVEVNRLCTTKERNIGFAFYFLLYLVTYVVVLSSSEIYSLVSESSEAIQSVGATGFIDLSGDSTDSLDETNYAKPIVVSAAIIALFSVGALRPIENTMRSLSHRIAGVPKGVYQIIDQLHRVPFSKFDNRYPKPLTDLFAKHQFDSFKNSDDEHLLDAIATALRTTDYLSPVVTSKLRFQYFPYSQLDHMGDLSAQLEDQIVTLKNLIKDTNKQDNLIRDKIFASAMATANDAIALFAVHYLRNNRAFKQSTSHEKHTPMAELEQHYLIRRYPVELNSFAMAALCATIAGSTLTYSTYWYWYNAVNIDTMHARLVDRVKADFSAKFVTSCNTEIDANCSKKTIDSCGAKPPPKYKLKTTGQTDDLVDLSEDERATCDRAWLVEISKYENELGNKFIGASFKNIATTMVAILLAAAAALFGRDIRLDENSWPRNWPLRRPPFLELISLSLLPATFAVLGIALAELIGLWISASFIVTESDLIFFVKTNYRYLLLHWGLGLVISLAVLVLSDQYTGMRLWSTLLLATVFTLLALLWSYIIALTGYPAPFVRTTPSTLSWFDFEKREAVFIGASACTFILFFGLWLKITEQSPVTTEPKANADRILARRDHA